jgi:hypothetical protein
MPALFAHSLEGNRAMECRIVGPQDLAESAAGVDFPAGITDFADRFARAGSQMVVGRVRN